MATCCILCENKPMQVRIMKLKLKRRTAEDNYVNSEDGTPEEEKVLKIMNEINEKLSDLGEWS